MSNITIEGKEVSIPDFFDTQAIQALFDSFNKPDSKRSQVFNLVVMADFLKLDDEADTLRDLLSLIDRSKASKSINIAEDLYAICKKLQGIILSRARGLVGESLTNYFYIFVGL